MSALSSVALHLIASTYTSSRYNENLYTLHGILWPAARCQDDNGCCLVFDCCSDCCDGRRLCHVGWLRCQHPQLLEQLPMVSGCLSLFADLYNNLHLQLSNCLTKTAKVIALESQKKTKRNWYSVPVGTYRWRQIRVMDVRRNFTKGDIV